MLRGPFRACPRATVPGPGCSITYCPWQAVLLGIQPAAAAAAAATAAAAAAVAAVAAAAAVGAVGAGEAQASSRLAG
ncbi:hypothetical protein K0M31_011453 [Melipona bicolor]|uniref:Uncharacterized protein n=1 Tax=Melipona bicolor TaxID=60889 RepID=A0AA40G9L6_9HYME|nr:hypothetical protein K0M31_011453 [Melipona bicolor]